MTNWPHKKESLMTTANLKVARAIYDTYSAKNREAAESLIGSDFRFTSPLDNGLNRESYFTICFRNTEILIVRDEKIVEVEVYFGWNIPHEVPIGKHRDPK